MSLPPRELIRNLDAYHAPEEGRLGQARLDFCEWTGPLHATLQAALASITPEQITAYPEYGAFTSRLAGYLDTSADCVLPTNGSDEALNLCVQGWVDPGQRMVIVQPTFSMIPNYMRMHAAEPVPVSLVRVSGEDGAAGGWAFNLPAIRDALRERGVRGLMVPSPNNPTGSWCDPQLWLDIAREFPDRLIVIDEAYAEFAPSRIGSRGVALPNLIVTGTFSKALGLAGLRLGWAMANPAAIGTLRKIRSPYSVNAVAVHLATALLDAPQLISEQVSAVRRGLDALVSGLGELGVPVYRGKSNAVLADFGDDAARITEALAKRRILVRDLSRVPLIAGCVRINAGTPEQTTQLLAALKELLAAG
ncbi:MAG: histidinol-phosphate transaminase [Planctomycetota bacterium]